MPPSLSLLSRWSSLSLTPLFLHAVTVSVDCCTEALNESVHHRIELGEQGKPFQSLKQCRWQCNACTAIMQSYRSLSRIYYCNDGMFQLHFGLKSVAKPKQPITLNAWIVSRLSIWFLFRKKLLYCCKIKELQTEQLGNILKNCYLVYLLDIKLLIFPAVSSSCLWSHLHLSDCEILVSVLLFSECTLQQKVRPHYYIRCC